MRILGEYMEQFDFCGGLRERLPVRAKERVGVRQKCRTRKRQLFQKLGNLYLFYRQAGAS